MPAVNKTCPVGQFQCADGRCIFLRYQCDNFKDCRDGSDETVELCGYDPCRDRIQCGPNQRCIPISWCCHRPASVPDGPYVCDSWQRQICCSSPAISNSNFDQGAFFRGSQIDDRNDNGYSFTDSKRSAIASSSSSGHDTIWGFQSAIFVVAGCTLAFVALILLASFLGAKYLVRKLHQVPVDDEEHERCHHRHRFRHCRSHSAPRPSSIADVGPSMHSGSAGLDNSQLLPVYFINGHHHCHRNNRIRIHHDEPSCSILLQYPTASTDLIADPPPPPYSDLGAASDSPPEYDSLPVQQNSSLDDGLPGYSSALELRGPDTTESTDQ